MNSTTNTTTIMGRDGAPVPADKPASKNKVTSRWTPAAALRFAGVAAAVIGVAGWVAAAAMGAPAIETVAASVTFASPAVALVGLLWGSFDSRGKFYRSEVARHVRGTARQAPLHTRLLLGGWLTVAACVPVGRLTGNTTVALVGAQGLLVGLAMMVVVFLVAQSRR